MLSFYFKRAAPHSGARSSDDGVAALHFCFFTFTFSRLFIYFISRTSSIVNHTFLCCFVFAFIYPI